jgi:hypothetical protein
MSIEHKTPTGIIIPQIEIRTHEQKDFVFDMKDQRALEVLQYANLAAKRIPPIRNITLSPSEHDPFYFTHPSNRILEVKLLMAPNSHLLIMKELQGATGTPLRQIEFGIGRNIENASSITELETGAIVFRPIPNLEKKSFYSWIKGERILHEELAANNHPIDPIAEGEAILQKFENAKYTA